MDGILALDYGVMYFAGSRQRPWLTPIMMALTRLGDTCTLTVVVVVFCGLFLWVRRRPDARGLAAAGLFSLLLNFGLKAVVGRERPDVVWRVIDLPEWSSFPSGHALGSLGVYGSLALLLARDFKHRWQRWLLVGPAFALAGLIGVSRVYLGVHFPLDVLAGWAGGTVAILLALALSERPPAAASAPPPGSEAVTARPEPPAASSSR
jgi:membrane-associated phospholipid phosphatase